MAFGPAQTTSARHGATLATAGVRALLRSSCAAAGMCALRRAGSWASSAASCSAVAGGRPAAKSRSSSGVVSARTKTPRLALKRRPTGGWRLHQLPRRSAGSHWHANG
eukprot:5586207-Alexandrium_andersonii.AAC.1